MPGVCKNFPANVLAFFRAGFHFSGSHDYSSQGNITKQRGQLARARGRERQLALSCGEQPPTAEVMAAVVPEEEHAPSLVVAEREAPARGEAAEVLEMGVVLGVEVEEVLEMGVVLGVEVEEVPARSEEAEVLRETGVVQGVVVDEGPPLTNGSLRDWVNRWCSGDRGGLLPISTWNTSQVTDMSELF